MVTVQQVHPWDKLLNILLALWALKYLSVCGPWGNNEEQSSA